MFAYSFANGVPRKVLKFVDFRPLRAEEKSYPLWQKSEMALFSSAVFSKLDLFSTFLAKDKTFFQSFRFLLQ
jgi:hypothetical protein